MMKGKEDGGKRRRPYQKPRVEQVELLSEEVLQLGGCKNTEEVGPTEPNDCYTPTQCTSYGS